MNEPHSLASQRGLSKSSAGRLPLPFPVGQPGRVYFAMFANNIADLVHTRLLFSAQINPLRSNDIGADLSSHSKQGVTQTNHAALFCTGSGAS